MNSPVLIYFRNREEATYLFMFIVDDTFNFGACQQFCSL